jgi:hypothetical protein
MSTGGTGRPACYGTQFIITQLANLIHRFSPCHAHERMYFGGSRVEVDRSPKADCPPPSAVSVRRRAIG